MNKNFTIISCILFFLTFFASGLNAQQSYNYNFTNNFNEANNSGPALNQLGTGNFINGALQELSCMQRPVYNFDINSGVQFDNNAAGNFLGESYSIEMYFQFLSNTGFRRIIDFKNQTSDFGLYSTNTILQFYDAITINTTAFDANQYVYLVVTRDSASALVNLYVDGSLAGSFIDTTGLGVIDNSNVLNFFRDDLVFGGEAQAGTIALLNFYNTPIDAANVAANFSTLENTAAAVSFIADNAARCVGNNLVNFTNTSQNSGAVSYNWDFGDANGTSGLNASHSYNGVGIYTVLLIADDGAGCVDTFSRPVAIYAQPVLNLGSDVLLCSGDSVTLDAGAGYSGYLWNDNSNGQVLNVFVTGTYIATITDSNSCTASDSVDVNFIPAAQVNLGVDTIMCSGSSLLLSAPSGQNSYFWSTGDTTETITAIMTGVYAVEVTNAAGCVSSDTIEVTINPPVSFSLGTDLSGCDGDTLVLDAGISFASYLWNDNSANATLPVTTSGDYSVTVTDIFGCNAFDTVTVTINPLPVINLGPNAFFCGGTPFTLDAGAGFVTYLWNDNSAQQTLNVTSAGLYAVTVTDANGCSGNDVIVLGITPSFSLGADVNVCDGTTATIDAGSGFSSYLWNDGSGLQTLDVTASGNYTVTVSDVNGCQNFDEITVNFLPKPIVNIGPDLTFCSGLSALLDAGSGFTTYLWSDNSVGQILVASQSGIYAVTVTNIAGCSAVDSVTIIVNPSPLVNLGADTILCSGSQLILDAGPGFVSYQWIGGSSQQTLTVNATNNYFVVVTDTSGCTGSDDIDVIINAPVPTPVISQVVNTLYSNSPTGNQWYSIPGGIIPGATDSSFSPGVNGVFYVVVTDNFGCSSAASPNVNFVFDFVINPDNISFLIYPNPASDYLIFQINDINSKNYSAAIFDITGKKVKSINIEGTGSQELDISALENGTYLLQFISEKGLTAKRLIIAR